MSDIKDWSKSAGGNTASAPDGAPEGMPPSGVNDTMRENMASIRRQFEDAEWFNYGDTPSFATTASFTLVGDKTTDFHVNRRVKCYDATVLYGVITDNTFSASTRVNVELDSGEFTSSLTGVAVSILSYDNPSAVKREAGSFDVSGTASVGALRVSAYDMPVGMLINSSATLNSTYAAGSGTASEAIAYDNSIPQITEGIPIMDFSYSPKRAGDKISIYSLVNGSDSSVAHIITAAMFVNSATAAVAAVCMLTGNAYTVPLPLNYDYSASSTGTITVSVRIGNSDGITAVSFNGTSAQRFGGVMASGIWVKEYKG